MRRFCFVAAAAALTIIPILAQAADLPRGPAARSPGFLSPEPVANWSGFYVGVSAGYGWGDSRATVTTTGASSGGFDVDGGIVGGTFGYNRQIGEAGNQGHAGSDDPQSGRGEELGISQ